MRTAFGVSLAACWLLCSVTPSQPHYMDVFNQGFAPPRLTAAKLEQEAARGLSLKGLDLSGATLTGLTLTDQDLSGSLCRKADLRGARLTNCNLAGTDFSEGYLGGAAFIGCSLQDAVFRSASLRGAYFERCDLAGSTFDGADLAGATLTDVRLSATGARHLPALKAAIELQRGRTYTWVMVAAASGDAFAFTYDRANRPAWPGTPMTLNPLLAACQTLGVDAVCRTTPRDAGGARQELVTLLRRGLVAVLPMRLAGNGLSGDSVEGPTWVVAQDLLGEGQAPEGIRLRTPFGPMVFDFEDFMRRWAGPWPTLVPAGSAPSTARFPLCTVGAVKAEVGEALAAVAVLRQATAILKEPRAFGDSHGGLAAYEALIADLQGNDSALGDLVHWSDGPRTSLAASRGLAAAFLREAAPSMPPDSQPPMQQAADLYDEVARLLGDEWPLPDSRAFEGEARAEAVAAAGARRPHAAAALTAALERERQAVALLEPLTRETAAAPAP